MSFELDQQDTASLGLFFKQGALYKELLKLPKPKETYAYDWKDQHGKERDTISPVRYEELKYSIDCYMIADNIDDLQIKRSAILELLSNPTGFVLYSQTLGRTFKLFYEDSPSFNVLNSVINNGRKVYCEFTLNLINNWDDAELIVPLEDVNQLALTELGDQIYVMIKKQLF